MKTKKMFLCTIDEEDGELVTLKMAPVDLDALLALADEMQGHADAEDYGGDGRINAGCLWSYADRIREALGASDG